MGIDGLLKFLRPITTKEHISSFKGQRVGIDVMAWIYRGCYSDNFQKEHNNNQSIRYVYYILQMNEIFNYYNIKPIFVFDGRCCKLKNDTNQKRIKQKQQYKEKATKLLAEGKLQQARKYYSRCIFIDEKIISTTINILQSRNIQFMVAPYEADCQLAKLKNLNLIDVAISEDSDLLVYGVNTILKLNQNGDCDYVDLKKWGPRDVDQQFLKEFLAMNWINRIDVAILAGSDYNPSIYGIGIIRAVKNIYRQVSMKNVINKLKMTKLYAQRIPDGYDELVEKVKMIFLFATVFNPIDRKLQQLNPQLVSTQIMNGLSEEQLLKIVGEHYSQYIDKEVYLGKTTPKDLLPRDGNTTTSIRYQFRINKENIIVHETINNKRRLQEQQFRQKRQEDIKNGRIKQQDMKSKEMYCRTADKSQLTEQQKKKRKEQRKNRIIKLQDVMNSIVGMIDDEQKQKQKQKQKYKDKQDNGIIQNNEVQNNIEEIQKGLDQVYEVLGKFRKGESGDQSKYRTNSEESEAESQKNRQDLSCQQAESIDLSFLNPFAKDSPQNKKKSLASSLKK